MTMLDPITLVPMSDDQTCPSFTSKNISLSANIMWRKGGKKTSSSITVILDYIYYYTFPIV